MPEIKWQLGQKRVHFFLCLDLRIHSSIMSVSLAKVSTKALLDEVQRRLNCSEKEEKRTIFIGESDVHWHALLLQSHLGGT
jgi:hypothetical protein